jgi:hypothetical protein
MGGRAPHRRFDRAQLRACEQVSHVERQERFGVVRSGAECECLFDERF